MSKYYIDVTDYQERLARVPMELRTYRKAVEVAEDMPIVKAIPIEVVKQIRAEIEQEYNKFRNMSDKWDERASGLGTALEIIDRALDKEQSE